MWFVSSDGGNEKEIGPETYILTDWPDGLSARRALFDAGVTLGILRGVGSQYAVTSQSFRTSVRF